MDPQTVKWQKMTHPKKRQKTYRHHEGKMSKIVSKWREIFTPVTFKNHSNLQIRKNAPQGRPGIQKASKKCPKGIQKASKSRPVVNH